MNHGSLFSGIGGFDLASRWCGWNNIFQVEIDKFCRKTLKKNFPNVERYQDIYEFDGTKYRGSIDIISGGFPCQPFSVAGKQKGKEDDRFLWPEMVRVIKEIQPTWIVAENVAGIISMALDEVLFNLEAIGYEVQAFIIPACAVNAPHRRDRVWIVANNDILDADNRGFKSSKIQQQKPTRVQESEYVADSDSFSSNTRSEQIRREKGANINRRCERSNVADSDRSGRETCWAHQMGNISGEKTPPLQSWWSVEPSMDRVANGIPGRVDRLKALGNSIVPQVAYEIFRNIDIIERGES
jgi:DNA (cytosine-5)-methyltransferase 1